MVKKENDYEKYLMKSKIDTNDKLPLGKSVSFSTTTVIIRSFFEKYGKYYPNFFRQIFA